MSEAYYYSYILAYRRGIPVFEIKSEAAFRPAKSNSDIGSEEDPEKITTIRNTENLWRREFMDTYRHLREHGNSAFIFLLELVLAGLVYCVVSKPGQTPSRELSGVGLLFGIWAVPSAFIHLLAQHLERRFSQYDQKLKTEVEHS
ncbi:MAG: hypothetical protein ACRD3B_04705 [Candidatus Sulfotelmatobacter sp.]